MSGDVHVRFWEGLGVKFPRATHLPLYRLERIFKRHGVDLARSSMCRWMQDLAALCKPLLTSMKQQILCSHVIQSDDTPVKQQDHESRSGKTKTCRFWSYVGDKAHPYVVYAYTLDRSRAGPEQWFRDEQSEPNFRGPLQCDAYVGYDRLFEPLWQMIHIGCWAHVRRKFHDARLSFPGPCHQALAIIGQLYQVERRCKDLDADARRQMRQAEARPLLDQFWSWCDQCRRESLPKSALGLAIQYALNLRPALERYIEDGDLDIDNNACERSLRGIAIGRRNWLFTGSPAGGHRAVELAHANTSCTQEHDDATSIEDPSTAVAVAARTAAHADPTRSDDCKERAARVSKRSDCVMCRKLHNRSLTVAARCQITSAIGLN